MATLTVTARPSYAGTPTEETGFGSNPGALQMFRYAPAGLPAGAPLVVAMHGCTQNARQYGDETGWLQLADRWHFALLLPQKPFGGCFSWYDPAKAGRGQGEALSVTQMVDRMLTEYRGDARRVYVTGLSAGGAMTAVMLAAYPDVFAGGGVVAGLPFRCATTMIQAYTCMNPGVNRTPQAWGDLARAASPYRGPRPPVSIWHGTSDTTVVPANLTELVEQWTDASGADQAPDVSDTVAGYPHRVYADGSGRPVVETYQITGMPHGQPVAPAAEQCGHAGTYSLDKGVCAAYHIGLFWGLG
ncbi:alpha/beta hydrolase family esterase [Planosporangium sp. 12N6]|uniref:extracellular catalytic domain type 1 short-chain-length polyhydroxyalkanoate depolymerase n=1 Tax=Planosporangium spinosum TaxID=3402278 RepID=UPI003CF86515